MTRLYRLRKFNESPFNFGSWIQWLCVCTHQIWSEVKPRQTGRIRSSAAHEPGKKQQIPSVFYENTKTRASYWRRRMETYQKLTEYVFHRNVLLFSVNNEGVGEGDLTLTDSHDLHGHIEFHVLCCSGTTWWKLWWTVSTLSKRSWFLPHM